MPDLGSIDQSSFIIEELGGTKRSVTLYGPSLPFRGATWDHDTIMDTTWYPGNAKEATQQVMVPALMPSTFEGCWKRTQMGKIPCSFSENGAEGKPITSPIFLRDLIYAIWTTAIRLRVTWSRPASSSKTPKTQKVVREGRIGNYKFKHGYADDVEWEIKFVWVSAGGSVQRVVATRDSDLASELAQLDASLNDAVVTLMGTNGGAAQKKFVPPTSFSLGQIEALLNAPKAFADSVARKFLQISHQIGDVVDLINQVRGLPGELASSGLALAENTINVANQFVDEMSQRPAEENVAEMRLDTIARQAQFFGGQTNSAIEQSKKASLIADTFRAKRAQSQGGSAQSVKTTSTTLSRTILAVHVTREGDTLPSIAKRYYKNASHSVDIAKTNHLPWHQVQMDPGQILIIPILGTAGSQT